MLSASLSNEPGRMKQKRNILFVLIIALASCSKVEKPNLIYLLADQHRADVLGFMGDKSALTPNLDQMAADGMVFDNAVAVSPVCAPYRSSLFTGKYISSTGMVINEVCINPNHKALGYVLHEGGYDMAYLGKWHMVDIHKRDIPQGPARLGFQHASLFQAYNFNHQNYKGFYWTDEGDSVVMRQIEGNQTEYWTNTAIEYIRRAGEAKRSPDSEASRGKPFALFLSYSPPHDPWKEFNVDPVSYNLYKDSIFSLPENYLPEPDQYADRMKSEENWKYWTKQVPEALKAYYAMVHHLDGQVGRIMDCLEEEGLEEETIVIYTSDHGEMFGSQGRVYKLTFFEEAARIPFIVNWKGHIKESANSDVCINTPDIAPTILGLLDLPVPAEMEGMDLSHALLGNTGSEPDFALLQGMGHTYRWINGSEWRAIRDKQFTYARYLVDGSEHMYDNQNDPLQMNNLALIPDWTEKLSKMREAMAEKMLEINDEFKPCTWYRDNWMDPDDHYSIIAAAQGKFEGPYKPMNSIRATR